jgi:3-oxoacyl-[acyl-carrier protein] reductase
LSLALAEELHSQGIRVHVICPGGVATDMAAQVRPDIPKEDLIQPAEIADTVLFLLTRQGKGVVDEIRIRRSASGPWF